MKLTNTIIALVLLAGLGGVLYYLNKHPKTEGDTDTRPKLFSFKPDQVKEISIEMPDKPAADIRRAGGSPAQPAWQAVSPAGIAMDGSQVQSFLDDVVKIQYSPLDSTTPSSLAEYGLDKPTKTFKFQLAQGQPVTLLIGKENPGGLAKYGMLSTQPGLFMLDVADTAALDKTLFDLRDKRVMPVPLEKLQKIALKFNMKAPSTSEVEKAKRIGLFIKPPLIVVTKQPNDNWQVTEPAVRTDFGNTNYLVTSLAGSAMDAAETDDPKSLASYGLDNPGIRVEVTSADGSTHTLLVGKKAEKKDEGEKKPGELSPASPGYYAKNSEWPTVFTINQTLYDQLNQDLENYRNRFLFDFTTSNARRLEVKGPEGELRLDRKGDDWVKQDGKHPDLNKLNTFLSTIHDLRIQRYPEDRPGHFGEFGLDKPFMTITVTYSESNQQETIVFATKDKKCYAARKDSPSVYEMVPDALETLQSKLKDLSG